MTALRRPLFKYFGSKWSSVRYYPEPRFADIVEVCAGSAAYASHYPEREVLLIDADPEVCGLLSYLIGADIEEIKSLPVASLHPGDDLRDLGLSHGAADLIRRWQRVGRNDCWTVSKWNNMPGMWQESVKFALAESIPRIRHWRVMCLAHQTLGRGDWVPATWFVDPPYQRVNGYKIDTVDYRLLAGQCHGWARTGQVIVCEQQGADWLPFVPSHSLIGMRGRTRGRRGAMDHEVIWIA